MLHVTFWILTAQINCSGTQVEFLPAYSPDYNPIELAFSAMKYHLRRNGDYVRLAMTELSDKDIFLTLTLALYQISAEDVSPLIDNRINFTLNFKQSGDYQMFSPIPLRLSHPKGFIDNPITAYPIPLRPYPINPILSTS